MSEQVDWQPAASIGLTRLWSTFLWVLACNRQPVQASKALCVFTCERNLQAYSLAYASYRQIHATGKVLPKSCCLTLTLTCSIYRPQPLPFSPQAASPPGAKTPSTRPQRVGTVVVEEASGPIKTSPWMLWA